MKPYGASKKKWALGPAVLIICLHASAVHADSFSRGLQAQEAGRFSTAIIAYREAAEAGQTSAMVNLGNLLRAGLGTEVDHLQAVHWYRLAASAGNPLGQVNLANMYLSGWGVEASTTEAVRWFRRAAGQGDATAQHNLGLLLSQSGHALYNPSEALFWFELASRGGIQAAEYASAQLASNLTKEAVHETRIRADRFRATSENPLDDGFTASYEALQAFGNGAVSAAFSAFEQAALGGETRAQFELAQMYQHGIGIAQDPALAQYWLQVAARNGHRLASTQLRSYEDFFLAANAETTPSPTETQRADAAPATATTSSPEIPSTPEITPAASSQPQGAQTNGYFGASDSPTEAIAHQGPTGIPEAPPQGSVRGSADARIESLLVEWSEAWSQQDFARYIGFYSEGFVPAGGLSKTAWRTQRQSRLRNPQWIAIELGRAEIDPVQDTRWRVQFMQNYRSNLYQSETLKELVLGLEDGVLRIESERVLR